MKCIYDKRDDVAFRVKDNEAAKLVKAKPERYSYTTKMRWKSHGRLFRGN